MLDEVGGMSLSMNIDGNLNLQGIVLGKQEKLGSWLLLSGTD